MLCGEKARVANEAAKYGVGNSGHRRKYCGGSYSNSAEAYLGGLKALEAVGITWVHVHVPGDSVEHAAEVIERFRREVIDVS